MQVTIFVDDVTNVKASVQPYQDRDNPPTWLGSVHVNQGTEDLSFNVTLAHSGWEDKLQDIINGLTELRDMMKQKESNG